MEKKNKEICDKINWILGKKPNAFQYDLDTKAKTYKK